MNMNSVWRCNVNILRFIPCSVREFLAPITVRFFDTEDLLDTMVAMEAVLERSWIDRNESTDQLAERTQMIVGRELIRRKVRFWKEF